MGGEDDITDCYYHEDEVGRHISSTKVRLRWSFFFKKNKHWIELYESRMTNRKRIVADGKDILPKQV